MAAISEAVRQPGPAGLRMELDRWRHLHLWLAILMIRLKSAHPALVLAFAGNLAGFSVSWLGSQPFWQAICDAAFLSG